jgi:hypothetical protein
MKAYGGVCINPSFFDLGTSWRWVVIFMSTSWEISPGTHWIGAWVGPRTALDDMEERKNLPLPGLELPPLGFPARSQQLYRLSYLGCCTFSELIFGHNLITAGNNFYPALSFLYQWGICFLEFVFRSRLREFSWINTNKFKACDGM